jgi:hypothetical protein
MRRISELTISLLIGVLGLACNESPDTIPGHGTAHPERPTSSSRRTSPEAQHQNAAHPATQPEPAAQHEWSQAERAVKRLPPSAFPDLPVEVVEQLEARGCMIPQVSEMPKPHNVIRGQFARKGQTDWAVLCSKDGQSSILVFWGKPCRCPTELALTDDKKFLQNIEGKRIGYSRYITAVDQDFILEHYKAYGGLKPPPLEHEGIEDGVVEKGSLVHYCYRGQWLALTGVD